MGAMQVSSKQNAKKEKPPSELSITEKTISSNISVIGLNWRVKNYLTF